MDIQYIEEALTAMIQDKQDRSVNIEIYFSGLSWKVWLQGVGNIVCEFNLDDAIEKTNQWLQKNAYPSRVKFEDLSSVSTQSIGAYNQAMESTYTKLTGEQL